MEQRTSGARGAGESRSAIAVLGPEVDDALLGRLREELVRGGWRTEASRGDEQTVLVVSGSGSLAEVEAALAPAGEVDVLPLASGAAYARVRRQRLFLSALTTGLALLIAVGIVFPVVDFLAPQEAALVDPDLLRLPYAGRIPEDGSRLVSFHRAPVLVVHRPGGRFFAVSAACTHVEACRLEWDAALQRLQCPCHGDAFDVHGNVLRGPASLPLVTYSVERRDDDLYLERRG